MAKGDGADPEASRSRANRRRRTRIRQYCIHNQLTRLWTLTYASAEWDVDRIKAHLNRFFRELRVYRGGRFPYVWVIEEHPGGHGYHVHVAMSGFISKKGLEAVWGHGWVQFSDSRKRVSEACNGAQLAAYFAKELSGYIAKGADTDLDGGHFYDVAQGFLPPVETCEVQGDDVHMIGHVAGAYFGGEAPHRVWCSDELGDEWEGPRVLCLYWYGRNGP